MPEAEKVVRNRVMPASTHWSRILELMWQGPSPGVRLTLVAVVGEGKGGVLVVYDDGGRRDVDLLPMSVELTGTAAAMVRAGSAASTWAREKCMVEVVVAVERLAGVDVLMMGREVRGEGTERHLAQG